MKRLSVRRMLMSLTPALSKPSALHKMKPPIKAPLPAALTTAEHEALSEKKSLLEPRAVVLRTQPASSDSELSPLSDEEPVVAKKPARKKRKVAIKRKVVVDEGSLAAADDAAKPVETTRSKRRAKVAVVEAENLEDTQENQMSKKRKRKPTVIEPAVYDIPDVEKKESTFKGRSHLHPC